jgi:hypothetical protein
MRRAREPEREPERGPEREPEREPERLVVAGAVVGSGMRRR